MKLISIAVIAVKALVEIPFLDESGVTNNSFLDSFLLEGGIKSNSLKLIVYTNP